MMERMAHSAVVAWLAVLVWLALMGFLMLAPGEGTPVEDISRAFGGTDVTDALGHVVLFGVLIALLAHALGFHVAPGRALGLAAGSAFVLGAVLELTQLAAVARGATPLDLMANWFGVLVGAAWLRRSAFLVRAGGD